MIAAVLRLIDVPAFRWLLRVNRGDFALAVASFVGVLVLGILPGVGFAVALSVLAVLERAWHPYTAVLGRVAGAQGLSRHAASPRGAQVPGLLLFRFDAPLFFANAEVFRDALHRALAAERRPVRTVVVAAEPITDVDSTAAEVLGEIDAELERAGIELAFAELKGPVKDKLRRYGLMETDRGGALLPDDRARRAGARRRARASTGATGRTAARSGDPGRLRPLQPESYAVAGEAGLARGSAAPRPYGSARPTAVRSARRRFGAPARARRRR